eukprot:9415062-Lingulodinium_polyedra.AAC.1
MPEACTVSMVAEASCRHSLRYQARHRLLQRLCCRVACRSGFDPQARRGGLSDCKGWVAEAR